MFAKPVMRGLLHLLLLSACIVAANGCRGPRLASAPLTAEQQQWADQLQRWHPGWKKPYIAPIRRRRVRDTPATSPSPRIIPSPPRSTKTEVDRDVDEVIFVPVTDQPGEAGGEPGRQHIIEQGDSLSQLALQYYNDVSAWKIIWNANRDVLNSPDRLQPGTVLEIPRR